MNDDIDPETHPVEYAGQVIIQALDELRTMFTNDVRMTCFITCPDYPNGNFDMLVSEEEIDELIRRLKIRKAESTKSAVIN